MGTAIRTRRSVASLLAVVLLVGCPLMLSAFQLVAETCHTSGHRDDSSESWVDCCLAVQNNVRYDSPKLTHVWLPRLGELDAPMHLPLARDFEHLNRQCSGTARTPSSEPTLFLLNAVLLI